MGCCCSSNRMEWNDTSRLHHYPVVPTDSQLLSARNNAAAVISTGLLVNTNLDTSIPDTYRHPPAPIPYDANPQGPPNNQDNPVNKNHSPVQTNNSEPVGETKVNNGGENVAKESMEAVATEEFDTELEKSDELKKSNTPFVSPEECPTCLEEYDEENPKIITKCEHHFHLACILEWMERSDTCPVCDQVGFNFSFNDSIIVIKSDQRARHNFRGSGCFPLFKGQALKALIQEQFQIYFWMILDFSEFFVKEITD